jgi:hypothetical protein
MGYLRDTVRRFYEVIVIPKNGEKFGKYMTDYRSPGVLLLIILLHFFQMFTFHIHNGTGVSRPTTQVAVILLILITAVPGLILFGTQVRIASKYAVIDNIDESEASSHKSTGKIINSVCLNLSHYEIPLQLTFVAGFVALRCVALALKVYSGDCSSPTASRIGFCNPFISCEALPLDTMITAAFSPMVIILIVSKYRLLAFTISLIVTSATVAICNYLSNNSGRAYYLIFPLIVQVIVFYDNRKKDYEKFLMTLKLQETLEENKRLAAEEKASDLRAMIGNVAHDLKTVSSFIFNYCFFIFLFFLFSFFVIAIIIIYDGNNSFRINYSRNEKT